MGTLTEAVILNKCNAQSLAHIKNLNLWGSELQDISVISKMPNVEVLSLSVNKITSLEPFQHCPKLTEIYLRKNEVKNLDDLKYLKQLKNLKVLWMLDNPCAEADNYRIRVVNQLPGLQKLDHNGITEEEKTAAAAYVPPGATAPSKLQEGPARTSSAPVPPPPAGASAPALTRAQSENGTSKPSSSGGRRVSPNVLYAVMALLGDLDEEALRIVKTEVDQRLDAM